MTKPITREYADSQERVFDAALQAIRVFGYKIDNIDKTNGLLNFKTGMSWKSWAGQEMSILVLDNRNGTCTVDISGRRSQTGVILQICDWGEAAGIAKKVFGKMDEILKK
jgi:hypothetical protein